jgi:hypothetical protein
MAKKILCINGSRECTDYKFLLAALSKFNINPEDIKEIVSGKCRGGDELGELWAKQNKIKIKEFPALWDDLTVPNAKIKQNKFGKDYNCFAGFQRNQQMAEYADELLALQPSSDSSGTQDCVEKFKKLGKPVNVYYGDVEPKIKYKF